MLAFIGERFFNSVLCCNTCVIGSGNPTGFISLHAFPSNEHILQGIVQYMSHRQNSGYIRRRNDNGEWNFIFIDSSMEEMIRFPPGIPLVFHFFWIICFGKFLYTHSISFNGIEKGSISLPGITYSNSINKKRGMKSTTGERMVSYAVTDASIKNILLFI